MKIQSLKVKDKLTSIARFLSPENVFKGIFKNSFSFSKYRLLKSKNSVGQLSVLIVFQKVLSGDFCL